MTNTAKVRIVKSGTDTEEIMKQIISTKKDDEAFLVMDMGQLVEKYNEWKKNLPTIRPFYAVKCNDSLPVIKILSSLGCGFDCASKEEIRKVLSQGVSPKNIIYANPAKAPSHLLYARKVGVTLMTFDNVIELQKIKKYYPEARVVLRIRADAVDASIPLGTKFGCEMEDSYNVMKETAKLGLKLIGISFHVGTGCRESGAYPRAIKSALSLLPIAKKFGFQLSLIDIGGGFPGDAKADFYEVSRLINQTLEEKKHLLENMTLIAEPGRYFVCTAYKLATKIISVRETISRTIYTVNESIFGLFNCVWSENIFKIPSQLNKYQRGVLKRSAIYGNSPMVHDRLVDDCLLPELYEGEWVIFDDMGAYSVCLYSNFQSNKTPPVYYMVTEEDWRIISNEWRE